MLLITIIIINEEKQTKQYKQNNVTGLSYGQRRKMRSIFVFLQLR